MLGNEIRHRDSILNFNQMRSKICFYVFVIIHAPSSEMFLKLSGYTIYIFMYRSYLFTVLDFIPIVKNTDPHFNYKHYYGIIRKNMYAY